MLHWFLPPTFANSKKGAPSVASLDMVRPKGGPPRLKSQKSEQYCTASRHTAWIHCAARAVPIQREREAYPRGSGQHSSGFSLLLRFPATCVQVWPVLNKL